MLGKIRLGFNRSRGRTEEQDAVDQAKAEALLRRVVSEELDLRDKKLVGFLGPPLRAVHELRRNLCVPVDKEKKLDEQIRLLDEYRRATSGKRTEEERQKFMRYFNLFANHKTSIIRERNEYNRIVSELLVLRNRRWSEYKTDFYRHEVEEYGLEWSALVDQLTKQARVLFETEYQGFIKDLGDFIQATQVYYLTEHSTDSLFMREVEGLAQEALSPEAIEDGVKDVGGDGKD